LFQLLQVNQHLLRHRVHEVSYVWKDLHARAYYHGNPGSLANVRLE